MNVIQKKINDALIRFDAVPAEVESTLFERTKLEKWGDILEWSYARGRQHYSTGELERRVRKDLMGGVGREIARINACGLHPVLHVSFCSWTTIFFWQIPRETVARLAMEGRGISCESSLTVPSSRVERFCLSAGLVALLAMYGFAVEIV